MQEFVLFLFCCIIDEWFVLLPQMHRMLQQKTDASDADPAAESQQQRLGAGADQLDNIGVEPDGGHGKDDEELAQGFQRCEDVGGNPGYGNNGSHHGSQSKIENEHREDPFEGKGIFRCF